MPRLIVLVLLTAALLPAQPKVEFQHYQLANGMQVILHPDHTLPLAHFNLRFFVGSKHEAPGRAGFAHLFEHMMGENGDVAGGFVMVAEGIGATGMNANTRADSTDYYATVPSSRLERMLWLESNQWATLPSRLRQDRFELEREIVINERREKVDNQPYGNRNALIHQFVFPSGHPYSHDVIGTPEQLMAASLDDIRAFYRTYYTPDNASLVVSGDFDPADVKQWIQKYYGPLAPGAGLISPPISAAPMAAPKLVDVTAVAPYRDILVAWAGPGKIDPDADALEFAQFIIDERWHNQAFRDRIKFDPGAGYYQLEDASAFIAESTISDKFSLEQVRGLFGDEIGRFAREGPAIEEFERARNNLESRQLSSVEDLYGVSFALNEVQQYYGGVEHFDEWASRYGKVTPDGVKQAVSRWLLTPDALTIRYTPITTKRDATPEPDRLTPPPFETEKPFRLPEITSATLPNGLQIFVAERHGLPKVAVELRFNIGTAHSPAGKPAMAGVAMGTLGCGTEKRTEADILREASQLAVNGSGQADATSQYIGFEAQRKNLDAALELMTDTFLHPVYPKEIFERRKSDMIEGLTKTEGRIDNYQPVIGEIVFGPGHPLGANASNPESLRAITVEDVEEFRRRYWHPDSAVMVFAGDITVDDAVALAKKHMADWGGRAEAPGRMPPPMPMKGRTFLLERKGVTQTSVVMILPGIARMSPDYPALLLADNVLGGGVSARLYKSIRMDRGIAYGAGSYLDTLPDFGLWIANSPVQAEKTQEAMAVFAEELRGLAGARPITQAELDAAKQRLIRAWPEQFEWNGSTASAIASSWVPDKSLGELRGYQDRLAAVTLDVVNAVARKYAIPEKAVFLLVGDPEKIGPVEGMVRVR